MARVRGSARRERRKLTDLLPFVLIVSLFLPYRIEIGPILLSPNRILLLLALLPCGFMLISGRLGRLRSFDILILAHTAWMCLALFMAHPFEEAIQAAGNHVVEVMGSYLVARCYIRSAARFRAVISFLFISIVIMLPFTIAETITGQHYLNQILSQFGTATIPHEMEPRRGFERAFGVFEHPIHLGVFCASIFSLTYYVLGFHSDKLTTYMRAGLVSVAVACSLSSGPLLALVLQSLFMGWDQVTRTIRYRWYLLAVLAAFIYTTIDFLSNRTPFHVIVTYLTFNTSSAYNRIHIWHFGSAEVARHPLFGIGLNEWTRPVWMSSSMDNFWLVLAVQGGLPAFLLFVGAMTALCYALSRLRLTDPRLIAYRRGWMIAIVGLAIAGGTVHYWKALFSLVVFLIGSAAWMLDAAEKKTGDLLPQPARRGRPVAAIIPLG